MNKFRNFSKKLFKNRSGQGATEYILLLVVVVAMVILFKGRIKDALNTQLEKLDSGMAGITTSP
jgi:hypothetical protein